MNATIHIPDVAADLQTVTDALTTKGYGVGAVTVRLKQSAKRGAAHFYAYYVVRPTPTPERVTEMPPTRWAPQGYTRRERIPSVYGGMAGILAQIGRLPNA